jgi:hypothetical protein
MRQLSIVVSGLLLCSACLRSGTTITVRPDGSGTIDQELGVNAQSIAMLKGFATSTSEQKEATGSVEIFGPEQARKLADQMGVRFVSGEPIKTADIEGFRAHYVFDDITQVKMKMTQDATGGLGSTGDAVSEPPFGFDFERRGTSSILTIRMPQQGTGGAGALSPLGPLSKLPGGGSANSPEGAQALGMMKMMMRGLFVDVTLAVDGRLVKTNAPYVTGSQITLMQMDFDKLLESDTGLQKLQQASDPRSLQDIPGLKVVTDPTITIEFGR